MRPQARQKLTLFLMAAAMGCTTTTAGSAGSCAGAPATWPAKTAEQESVDKRPAVVHHHKT